ncbi:MAG: glycosyltransferase family 4 protein [Bacteroidota bacterium]
MNIWIINQYAGSRIHGMNFRSWYFANEMKKAGHRPHVISASYSHLYHQLPNIQGSFTDDMVEGIPYTWVKVRRYSGSQSIGRVLAMIQFMLRLFFFPKSKLNKPDIIMVSSLSPFPILNAWFWSKRYRAKLIFEVRDIWPLSLIEIGGMSRFHPLALFFGFFERFAYQKADKVISLLPKANEHMIAKGMNPKKFVYVPNGFDPNELSKTKPLSPEYLAAIPSDKFIVGYAGSIGAANAVEYLVEAATLLESQSNICFVIVGKGQHKPDLMKKAGKNVVFLDPVGKDQVQTILASFDVCYIGWHDHSIYRFGISPNKVFDYMFAAKPIIHSVNAGNDLVADANAGFSIAAEDPALIAETIEMVSKLPKDELNRLGQNGRKFVEEHHTYEKLTAKLLTAIV